MDLVEGQHIVATNRIGGRTQPFIPKGSVGVITKLGEPGSVTAVFLIKRWWANERLELVRVSEDDIEPLL